MVFLTEPVGHCFCPLAAGQKLFPTTVRNQLPLTAIFLRMWLWLQQLLLFGAVSGDGFLEEAPMDRPRKCSLTHCTRLT